MKAIDIIERLYETQEMAIDDTIYGTIMGHYAGSKYFFYCRGVELFRSSDKSKTIKFLNQKLL